MINQIDFWIIGAQKSGTTSLHNYLSQHQDIFMPPTKEIHFFNDDEFWKQGRSYLNSFYDGYKSEQVVGGAYVHTIFFEKNITRLKEHNPNIKLIALLRNPVERAYSAYWFAKKNGWETLESFEDALDAEEKRLKGNLQEQKELTYLSHGKYIEQLKPYLDSFDRSQIKIILTDELKANAQQTTLDLFAWLGVKTGDSNINTSKKINSSGMPRYPVLQKHLLQENNFKKSIRKITSPKQRLIFKNIFIEPILKFNSKPFIYPSMNKNTKQELSSYFKAYNSRLAKLINKDLSAWDES